MRERLRQFDGTLNIESDSSGTRVLATLPLPEPALPEEQSKAEPLQSTSPEFRIPATVAGGFLRPHFLESLDSSAFFFDFIEQSL